MCRPHINAAQQILPYIVSNYHNQSINTSLYLQHYNNILSVATYYNVTQVDRVTQVTYVTQVDRVAFQFCIKVCY